MYKILKLEQLQDAQGDTKGVFQTYYCREQRTKEALAALCLTGKAPYELVLKD